MLASHYYQGMVEAGCDEAGRGCLAGSVYAAAVIFPEDYTNEELNDSKQLTDRRRKLLRSIIERDAVAWAVGVVTPEEIDRINILNASMTAMKRAIEKVARTIITITAISSPTILNALFDFLFLLCLYLLIASFDLLLFC